MASFIQPMNGSITEGAANTLNTSSEEIPGTTGAQKVFLTDVELDVAIPDAVAATRTKSNGLFGVGKQTWTTTDLNETGGVSSQEIGDYNNADIYIKGPGARAGLMVEVPKHSDGKFYITKAVKGTNNTGAKGMGFSAHFLVVR